MIFSIYVEVELSVLFLELPSFWSLSFFTISKICWMNFLFLWCLEGRGRQSNLLEDIALVRLPSESVSCSGWVSLERGLFDFWGFSKCRLQYLWEGELRDVGHISCEYHDYSSFWLLVHFLFWTVGRCYRSDRFWWEGSWFEIGLRGPLSFVYPFWPIDVEQSSSFNNYCITNHNRLTISTEANKEQLIFFILNTLHRQTTSIRLPWLITISIFSIT